MEDLGSTILCMHCLLCASLGESINEGGHRENIKLKGRYFLEQSHGQRKCDHNIEESLGIKAYDIYGLTEISGPGVSFECEEQKGMHIQEDHFIPEIINPDTGEVLPERRNRRVSIYLYYKKSISITPLPHKRFMLSDEKEMFLWTYPYPYA